MKFLLQIQSDPLKGKKEKKKSTFFLYLLPNSGDVGDVFLPDHPLYWEGASSHLRDSSPVARRHPVCPRGTPHPFLPAAKALHVITAGSRPAAGA